MAVRRSKKRRVKSPVTPVATAKVKPMDRGGRPKWVPDAAAIDQIVKLAELDHPIPEIGAWFGVSEKTIDRRLAEMPELKARVDIAREKAKASFRQMMWRLARDGNPKAIGLLGAKMGWYPKQRVEHTGEVGVKVLTAVAADEIRRKVLGVGETGDRPPLRLVSGGE